ncbi:MAG: insulinase family protein [Candidatus Nealsonbacteria bacterium]|nr:insulinase family protein [Candidatus Nealsonbacteria bacterium]
MFRKTTLPNGLRIITTPQQNTEAVTVLVLVGTGSKYEEKRNNGISHFLEHMYFKGTKKRPDSLSVAETLDRVGGIYNAFTSEDFTGYFAKVESSQFELALEWVSDIFLNSTLPEKEIAKEKGVISEEINMRQDHPMEHVQTLWPKLLYGDQPAGRDIAGTKESVNSVFRADLVDYLESQYVAANTIVSIAGRINEAEAIRMTKKYFSQIRKGTPKAKPRVAEGQDGPAVLLETRSTDQAHICLGVRSFNVFHPQRYVQELLSVIMGEMMSSRLFIEVREKLGLAYYVRTDAEANPDTGYFLAQAGLDSARTEKGIETILREYRKISEKKISPAELKKAKDNLKGRMVLLLESSDAQASFYASQDLLEKKILTLKEIFSKIDKVSSSGILELARNIFRPQNLNLVVLGPFQDKEKFQKLLKL